MEALESMEKDCYLIFCIVERESYKGNPDYYYRKHPIIKLESIPTLMKVCVLACFGHIVKCYTFIAVDTKWPYCLVGRHWLPV